MPLPSLAVNVRQINFMLATYVLVLEQLKLRIRIARASGPKLAILDDNDRKLLVESLDEMTEVANKIEMPGVTVFLWT